MATINLGAIKFNWKGAYNNSTAYAVDDVVSSGGSSYVCILASQGNAVTNGTYWNVMSQAGSNGTDVGTTLTTQGDILYRNGSGLQRLAAGTSGQALLTGGSGANPSWGDAGGGMATLIKKTSISGSPTYVDFVHGTGGVTFNSTYDSYIILFDSLGCVNDVRMLHCRIFVGGSEYTANYNQAATGMYSGSGSANQNTARGTYDRNGWNLANVGASNASGEQNLSGIMRFYPNGYGAEYPGMHCQLQWWQDNNQTAGNYNQGGVMSTQNANGLRFQWTSDYNSNLSNGGAFANAGSITLYGVKTS